MSARILIIGDAPPEQRGFAATLARAGYLIQQTRATAVQPSLCSPLDLLIVHASGDNSTASAGIVALIAHQCPALPIIIVSENAGEDLAIAAIRSGVREYIKCPCGAPELLNAVSRCLRHGHNRRLDAPKGETDLVGVSAAIRSVRDYVPRVGHSDCAVLITGETGTGKELVAQSVHAASRRAPKTFVALNCAAIPDTLLESELFGYERGAFTGAASSRDGRMQQANGGTLFLDEIGELSLCAQAKILRAIETKEVQRLGGRVSMRCDFRIIAATNQDLEAMVATRQFRQDLYFRLSVARIKLPPLRERPEDIPVLLEHFLGYFNDQANQSVRGFGPDAMEILTRYFWPGNVRELRNTIEAMLICEPQRHIEVPHIPEHILSTTQPFPPYTPGGDRARLVDALRATNWNKTRAARSLAWSRMTVYRKMVKYGLTSEKPSLAV